MRVWIMAAGALAIVPASASAQDFRWHGEIAKGRTLEVRGINGPIHASRAGEGEAEVTATKRGRKSDPSSVEIRTVQDGGNVIICAVYPSRKGRTGEGCRSGGSDNDMSDNDVEVTFEVRLPAGVVFEGATVNGDISARDLAGDASLTSVNGDIDVEAGGVARGTTVNGSIKAKLGRTDWDRTLRFTTVNGGITVQLPGNASTEIEASTVNGSVDSDFPISVRGRMNSGSLRGKIGEGGRGLDLTTVNGSIRLEKSR